MTLIDAHLAADRASMIQFLKGKAPVSGKFWLVNLLRFNPDGMAEYKKYAEALQPAMAAVGARPVFWSYRCRTVVNGAGAVMPVDGVFIGEYPSASALLEMNQSEAYAAAHHHRTAALAETAMYAIPPCWVTPSTPNSILSHPPDPSIRAPVLKKTAKELEAIDGNPEHFMQFMSDDRFGGDAPVWMLNLLQYEPPPGPALYREYAARAQSKISKMKGADGGRVGGVSLVAQEVHTLKGCAFDQIAIMCYPSRKDFVEYVVGRGNGSKGGAKDELVVEGFKLRQAGLAVQGLVCMVPDTVWDATDRQSLKSRL